MKFNKTIAKSVKDASEAYKQTLAKAIVDLVKLTGCRNGESFSFDKPIIATSASTWGESRDLKGIRLKSEMVLVNGICYHERTNEHGEQEITFLEALYDCETVFVSHHFHTDDYEQIYKRVYDAVKNY